MLARPNSLLLLLFLLTIRSAITAQTTPAPTPKPQDDVVRVYTELVQTDDPSLVKQFTRDELDELLSEA